MRAQRDQLGPVPYQLAELPGRRGRDPCLREATHPQQVGQVGGVSEIVLHPAVLEGLHASEWAKCTFVPASRRASTAHYQP